MGAPAFTTCPWKSESCTFAPWGLGSPALCQQLPSTWGGAVPCCPLSTLAAHSRAGTQNPIPSEHSAPGSAGPERSGASHVEDPPRSRARTPGQCWCQGPQLRVGAEPLTVPTNSCSCSARPRAQRVPCLIPSQPRLSLALQEAGTALPCLPPGS